MTIQSELLMFSQCPRVELEFPSKLLTQSSSNKCLTCLNKPGDRKWLLDGITLILVLDVGSQGLIRILSRYIH
jgi:hypothetical protein